MTPNTSNVSTPHRLRMPVGGVHRCIAWVSATLALGALLLALLPALAQARDGYITSFDGTKIVYSFFPAANLPSGQRAPTIMIGPGYSMTRDTNPNSASDGGLFGAVGIGPLRQAGYNVLTWDPRGFGDSGGTVETDSPDYERRDASALIDRIAQQPEVQLDSPGDPRLGMSGVSYGGGIQLITAALDPRVDAITPTIAWNSLDSALYKSQTAKGGWGAALFGAGASSAAYQGLTGGYGPAGPQPPRMQDPHTASAFRSGLATGRFSQQDVDYFAARGPDYLLSRIHVPTFLIEGTADTLFTLHEAIRNYAALKSNAIPLKMLWFCGGHGVCTANPGPDKSLIETQVIAWLDRYVKGQTTVNTGARFSWISDDGVTHAGSDYPLAAGAPLTGQGSGILPLAVGDSSGALIAATPAATAVNVPLAGVSVPTELLGEPSLHLAYQGTATAADDRIYAQLVNNQTHVVLGNQVTPLPVNLDGRPHTLDIPLEGVAVHAVPGSSYTLQIVGGSNVYFAQRAAGAVTLSDIRLSVPSVAPGASQVTAAAVSQGGGSRTGACSLRRLTFRLHAPGGRHITRVRVYLGRHLLLRHSGRRLTRITVGSLPPSGGRLRIETFQGVHLLRRSVRTLKHCHKGRPHTRGFSHRHHHHRGPPHRRHPATR